MKALKLDSSYRPVDIIDAVEALVLCLVGKAHSVESYSEEIHSVSESFKLPAVIVLKRYVKFQFTSMVCNRANVLWRDKNQCQYCGKKYEGSELTLDHVIPKSREGTNQWNNIVAACKKCNQRKGNKTPSESGMFLLKKPRKPKPTLLRILNGGPVAPQWKNYLWDFS